MNSRFIELVKQDIAKWHAAAKAIDELLPHVPVADRPMWQARAEHYVRNAESMRALLDENG
jgi:hypothetical protein